MRNFLQIGAGVDVLPLLLEVQRKPELWNRNPIRLTGNGPHLQTQDIWLRYKDETENKASDYRNFGDEHDSVWYPAYYALPSARELIFNLMRRVDGERLGGILIYRVSPGKKILPHVDTGWHVDYYEKFNICLQSNDRTAFIYDDEKMIARAGDVHHFVNNKEHGVSNDGADDHIVLTVCIRCDRHDGKSIDL